MTAAKKDAMIHRGMDAMTPFGADDARLWRLEEVADAAREIPIDEQTPRLRSALARLLEIPREAVGSSATPEDPPRSG